MYKTVSLFDILIKKYLWNWNNILCKYSNK